MIWMLLTDRTMRALWTVLIICDKYIRTNDDTRPVNENAAIGGCTYTSFASENVYYVCV